MCGEKEKKGFFRRFFEKLDKKMKEKASQGSCCSTSKSCCSSGSFESDKNKEGQGCC